MGYTQDKHVPGSNLSRGGPQTSHQGAVRRLDLLHLCTWGFGHPMSGSPELPRSGAGSAFSSKPLQPVPHGPTLTPPLAEKAPCLCAGRGRLLISLFASAADSCRPILMSSLNADGSPGYINAVFADVRLQPQQ